MICKRLLCNESGSKLCRLKRSKSSQGLIVIKKEKRKRRVVDNENFKGNSFFLLLKLQRRSINKRFRYRRTFKNKEKKEKEIPVWEVPVERLKKKSFEQSIRRLTTPEVN